MSSSPLPQREVVHGDALTWLRAHPALPGTSVIASLPDVSELGTPLPVWRDFFAEAARAALSTASDDGLCLFFQTDLKVEGRWISKAALVLNVAGEQEVPLLFHKVVCRKPPGSVFNGRPGFSHLLCFSRAARDDANRPTADVLPDLGEMPWSHSMGTRAAAEAVAAIRRLSPATRQVVAPFCGVGTALAAANAAGLDAIGIERNRKRAEKALLLGR